MYGKIFDSIYDGTLYGHWEAIVTMQQLIVLCTPDGVLDMTPHAIAARTSIPLKIIIKGLEFLSQPDPYSRTPGDDGRRIVLLDEHRPWGWKLVNHGKYMKLRDMEQKREADRVRIAEKRKIIKYVATESQESQAVAKVAYSDSDSDSDSKVQTLFANANGAWEKFWETYPRKTAKQTALKAWKRIKTTELPALMTALHVHKDSEQWQRGVIPHPATWLNQRRWEDEESLEINNTQLGQCMWNLNGDRGNMPRCPEPGSEERDRLIYCKAHQHLHGEKVR